MKHPITEQHFFENGVATATYLDTEKSFQEKRTRLERLGFPIPSASQISSFSDRRQHTSGADLEKTMQTNKLLTDSHQRDQKTVARLTKRVERLLNEADIREQELAEIKEKMERIGRLFCQKSTELSNAEYLLKTYEQLSQLLQNQLAHIAVVKADIASDEAPSAPSTAANCSPFRFLAAGSKRPAEEPLPLDAKVARAEGQSVASTLTTPNGV